MKDAIADHSLNGTPIVFTNWTASLINGEEECIRDLKKDNHTISGASHGSGGRNGSNGGASGGKLASGGAKAEWKGNGEPIEPTIHKIDITVWYGNVSKLNEKPWNTLPKLTCQWFIDHPDKQCPAKFKSNNNYSNKKKKSTRNVSFAETDDDSSGGEDETDGDSSSAEDDNSSTSSDGSGDLTNH